MIAASTRRGASHLESVSDRAYSYSIELWGTAGDDFLRWMLSQIAGFGYLP